MNKTKSLLLSICLISLILLVTCLVSWSTYPPNPASVTDYYVQGPLDGYDYIVGRYNSSHLYVKNGTTGNYDLLTTVPLTAVQYAIDNLGSTILIKELTPVPVCYPVLKGGYIILESSGIYLTPTASTTCTIEDRYNGQFIRYQSGAVIYQFDYLGLNTTGINADFYYWNGVNRTDLIAHPQDSYNFLVYTEGGIVYAKTGNTGQVTVSTIQACIDAVTPFPGGGSIIIKNGTYSEAVTVKNATRLVIDKGALGITFTVAALATCIIEDYNTCINWFYASGVLMLQYNNVNGAVAGMYSTFTNYYLGSGNLLGFVQPATYIIDVSGSTYRMWHGANSTLAYSGTNASKVLTYAADNLTSTGGIISLPVATLDIAESVINVTIASGKEIILQGAGKGSTTIQGNGSVMLDSKHEDWATGTLVLKNLYFAHETVNNNSLTLNLTHLHTKMDNVLVVNTNATHQGLGLVTMPTGNGVRMSWIDVSILYYNVGFHFAGSDHITLVNPLVSECLERGYVFSGYGSALCLLNAQVFPGTSGGGANHFYFVGAGENNVIISPYIELKAAQTAFVFYRTAGTKIVVVYSPYVSLSGAGSLANNKYVTGVTLFRFVGNYDLTYKTESKGTALNVTASTFSFNHSLIATPTYVFCYFNTTAVTGWAITASNSTAVDVTIAGSGLPAAITLTYQVIYEP